MQLAASRHRTEDEDCTVIGHSYVKIRPHTAKDDVKGVTVRYIDNYLPPADATTLGMKKAGSGQVNGYWTATLTAPHHRIECISEVIGNDGSHVIFGDHSTEKFDDEKLGKDDSYFRVPYSHDIGRIKTLAWLKDIVWYRIFPERFANGDRSSGPVNVEPWNLEDRPGREDFYGGDLQGVSDHLDDSQKLGTAGLYFCPTFKTSSNHKYDTIDYLQIDPAFGDKDLFAKVVSEAHKHGMKVMLDAAFNHLGD